MTFRNHVKTAYVDRTPTQLLHESPIALLGVTPAAETLLSEMKIRTVYDLALASEFARATRIVEAARDPEGVVAQHGRLPSDIIDTNARNIPLGELPDNPLIVISGFGASLAAQVRDVLGLETVRDVAQWPPYVAAKHIVLSVLAPDASASFDREAPFDLLPQSGRVATQQVTYMSTVLLDSTALKPRTWDGGLLDTSVLDSDGFGNVAFGAVLTFRQRWRPRAVALGQLLHSLPLAPGESTKLTVVDWFRRSAAAVSEDVEQVEALTASLDQTTAISEVTSAVAREFQEGTSTSGSTTVSQNVGGIGFVPSFGFAGGGVSGNASSAATYTVSSGSRTTSAEALQSIASRTQQNASLTRNRRAAIVSEVSDSETETITTRTVANHNHMHSLSIQYYEVVQLYESDVRMTRCERCLFIPMKLVNFRLEANVRRYLPVLLRAALDADTRSLLQQYGNVVRADVPFDRFADHDLDYVLTTLADFPIAEAGIGSAAAPFALPDPIEKTLILHRLRAEVAALRNAVASNVAAARAKRLLDSVQDASRFTLSSSVRIAGVSWRASDGVAGVELLMEEGHVIELSTSAEMSPESTVGRIEPGIPAGGVQSIAVRFDPAAALNPSDFGVVDLHVLLQRGARQHWLNLGFVIPRGATNRVTLLNLRPGVDARHVSDRLMDDQLHYSQQVWMNAERHSLLVQLSPFSLNLAGNEIRIVDYIDPAPVSVAGNYVAFRFTYESDAGWIEWREEQWQARPRTDVVPLATGGVFAEAVLGEFNSAEKLDLTRHWRWHESPVPHMASEIAPAEAGSHETAATPVPGLLPAAGITLQPIPALPALGNTEQALRAVIANTIFRDMSGIEITSKLLAASQEAARRGDAAAAAQARQTVQAYFSALDSLVKTVVSTGGSMLSSGTQLGGLVNSAMGAAGGASKVLGMVSGGSGAAGAAGAAGGAGAAGTDAGGAAAGGAAASSTAAGGAAAIAGLAETIGPIIGQLAPMLAALI